MVVGRSIIGSMRGRLNGEKENRQRFLREKIGMEVGLGFLGSFGGHFGWRRKDNHRKAGEWSGNSWWESKFFVGIFYIPFRRIRTICARF